MSSVEAIAQAEAVDSYIGRLLRLERLVIAGFAAIVLVSAAAATLFGIVLADQSAALKDQGKALANEQVAGAARTDILNKVNGLEVDSHTLLQRQTDFYARVADLLGANSAAQRAAISADLSRRFGTATTSSTTTTTTTAPPARSTSPPPTSPPSSPPTSRPPPTVPPPTSPPSTLLPCIPLPGRPCS